MVAFLHTRIKTYNNKVKKLYTCWYCIVCIKVCHLSDRFGQISLYQSGGILANLNNTLPKNQPFYNKKEPRTYIQIETKFI